MSEVKIVAGATHGKIGDKEFKILEDFLENVREYNEQSQLAHMEKLAKIEKAEKEYVEDIREINLDLMKKLNIIE